jgi:hypothetical protein
MKSLTERNSSIGLKLGPTPKLVGDASLVRLATWAWLVLLVVLAVKAVVSPVEHTTYPCFEAGTRCWWAGENMYDFTVCQYEYRYTPVFAVLFTPFAWLPTWLGGLLWNVVNGGVLFLALTRLLRQVFPEEWDDRRQGLYLSLVLISSLRGLWASQTNSLIVALVALAAAAILERRWRLAAFLLAGPVYIKLWPLAAAFLLVACYPRRLGWRFAAALLLLGLLPFLTVSPTVAWGHYRDWGQAVFGPMQVRHIYRDAWTIWEVACPPVSPTLYRYLQLGMAGLALLLCLWQRWWRQKPERQVLSVVLGFWCVWQLVFGPGVERNTICLIGPLVAWGVIAGWKQRGFGLVAAAYALLTLFSFGEFERIGLRISPWFLTALPIGSLLFGAWLILYCSLSSDDVRSPRAGQP